MMKAIILAAGRGSRMGALTEHQPKCLLKFQGTSLIEKQINSLSVPDITEIGIVGGYKFEMLKDFGHKHFYNQQWAETNMVSSLLCAKEWLEQFTCIISYSDIFYSSDAVKKLVATPSDINITYDPNWQMLWEKRFTDPLSDAETFQIDEQNYLTEIGNTATSLSQINGQYMGLLKITPIGWQNITNYLSKLSTETIARLSMTELLSNLLKKKIYAVPIQDEWYEVDSTQDLLVYQEN